MKKKEETRGIGDNQFPMGDQLMQAWSIIRKDVFNKICDPYLTFQEADKASEKCLEATDLIDQCLEKMGIVNKQSEYFGGGGGRFDSNDKK